MPRGRNTGPLAAAIGPAVEAVAATLDNISAPAGDSIDLEGYVDITAGAGTTAVTVRIRRGLTNAGALVGQPVACTLAAGNRLTVAINASDLLPNDIAGGGYAITVQQTAGTGNGTVNSAYLGALW